MILLLSCEPARHSLTCKHFSLHCVEDPSFDETSIGPALGHLTFPSFCSSKFDFALVEGVLQFRHFVCEYQSSHHCLLRGAPSHTRTLHPSRRSAGSRCSGWLQVCPLFRQAMLFCECQCHAAYIIVALLLVLRSVVNAFCFTLSARDRFASWSTSWF